MKISELNNKISAKKWVKSFFITVFALFIVIVIINIIKDPLMFTAYTTPFNKDAKVINERQQKINYITYSNNINYNAVIIGSSRATYFDTTNFNKDKRIYNLAFNGGVLPQYKGYLNYFAQHNKSDIKYIYLGLDFFQSIINYDENEMAEQYIETANEPFYRLKTLISADCLTYSLSLYKLSPQYLIREGGYKVTNDLFAEKDKKKRILEHLNSLYTNDKKPPYKETLIELKKAYPNAKFIVFTTPEPKTLLSYLMNDKQYYYLYERWLRETLDVFGEIHHFDYLNEVSLNEEEYFLDTHHLTTKSTNYITYYLENSPQKLDNFGITLNKNNLDEFLKKAKKEFKINY